MFTDINTLYKTLTSPFVHSLFCLLNLQKMHQSAKSSQCRNRPSDMRRVRRDDGIRSTSLSYEVMNRSRWHRLRRAKGDRRDGAGSVDYVRHGVQLFRRKAVFIVIHRTSVSNQYHHQWHFLINFNAHRQQSRSLSFNIHYKHSSIDVKMQKCTRVLKVHTLHSY